MRAGRESSQYIYIVDDESALAQMANAILGFRGYQASVFADPREALKQMRAASEKPALLITDCVMGPMSGIELIEEFKRSVPGVRTILLSGTITDEFVRNCPVQPDKFIPKPYAADTLLDTVEELVGAIESTKSPE